MDGKLAQIIQALPVDRKKLRSRFFHYGWLGGHYGCSDNQNDSAYAVKSSIL
jgi:hypothetical protein